MAALIVKFEGKVLRTVPVDRNSITIGRTPDNSIVIDNAAVSTRHARIEARQESLVLSDLESLNGTFVNGQRVQSKILNDGDVITIGKHTICVDEQSQAGTSGVRETEPARELVAVPAMAETFVLDTRERRQMIQNLAAAGERSQLAPMRVQVATLCRVDGKLDREEYPLTSKLTIIGKSPMATIKLGGWFKPNVAAQINRLDDGYYIGVADEAPKVNGKAISGPTLLAHGDLIEVCNVRLRFVINE